MDNIFSATYHTSTSSLVSTAAVVAGLPMKPEAIEGPGPASQPAVRWQTKGRTGRAQRGDKDEMKKFKKMKIDKYDEFQEWIDGDATLRYRPKDLDARKHLSGWAMRNTNNHNKKVLKKSCLGVFLCSKNCRNHQGELVTVRPATSDRARRKQMEKTCPRPGCDGKLYHVSCSGKSGYPVTHFWRVTDVVILFQSKGTHDHPRPDVVKTTSMAKMALLEYHRTHRHERPKEICRKVGVHLHKSFNRVDRVARQLREVQTALPGEEKENSATYTTASRSYSLRSHVRAGMFTSPQKASEAEHYGPQVQPYNSRSSYADYYSQGGLHDTWSAYAAPHEFAYAPYAQAEHISALQANSYVGYAAAAATGHPEYSQYDYATSSCVPGYLPGLTPDSYPTTDTSAIADNNPLDLVISRSDFTMPTTEPLSLTTTMSETFVTETTSTVSDLLTPVTSIPMMSMPPSTTDAASHQGSTSVPTITSPAVAGFAPFESDTTTSLKRPAPPELQSLGREPKIPRFDKVAEAPPATTPSKTIKLQGHTPSINIDLTNFSDIFDIGSGLGDEGLAGRPKSPVYQTLSPVSSEAESQGTREKAHTEETTSRRDASNPAGPGRDSSEHYEMSPGIVSPNGAGAKTAVTKPQESPVFAQLSTHHTSPNASGHPVTSSCASSSTAGSGGHEGEGETNNYLDKLVSMYLSKDADKPISHLKNEFQVYEKNGVKHPKALAAYTQEHGHYNAHEFFRAAASHQYESWCNDRRAHAAGSFRAPMGSGGSESAYPESGGYPYDYYTGGDHYSSSALSEQARYLYGGSGFTSPRYSHHQYFGSSMSNK